MNIEIHGAGRAGGALAIASHRAGHRIVAMTNRTEGRVEAMAPSFEIVSGVADLRIIAVADGAIGAVATQLASAPAIPTVHVSGSVSVEVLDPIRRRGIAVGSFHPLQTLPDPEVGAERMAGCWVAITAGEQLAGMLDEFARSLGCHPFPIEDAVKPLYHAAASATANYTLASIALAEDLYERAGVPFEASRPLIEAIIANAYRLGPRTALTGPIARGDVETVRLQRAAVEGAGSREGEVFRLLGLATALLAGADDEMLEALQ